MKYRENEKGVALLLALGFAALLLVLIMGFATNALIERKVAANNGDKTQARGLAMSAVNRAIVAMQYQMHEQIKSSYDQGLHRFDNIVSKRDNATAAEVFSASDIADMFYEISTDRHLFKYRNHFYIYEYPKKNDFDYSYNENGEVITADKYNKMRRPQWQDVKNTDSQSQIIGRFWYAVLPDLGRFSNKANGTEKDNKKGITIKEFDISQIGTFSSDSDLNFDHIANWAASVTAEDNVTFKEKAFALFNHIEPQETSAAQNIRGRYYRNSFGTDKDKFEKKMFNILSEKISADSGYDDLIDQVEYLSSKNTGLEETIRKTIAANIIGAFKNDPSMADISDSSDWISSAPTFTGNLRTPYINEIEVKITGLSGTVNSETVDDVTTRKITPKADVELMVELYDPYNVGIGDPYELIFKNHNFKVRFLKVGDNPASGGNESLNIDFEKDSTHTVERNANNMYTVKYKKTVEASAEFSGTGDYKIYAIISAFKADFLYERNNKYVDYVSALGADSYASTDYASSQYDVKDNLTVTAGSDAKAMAFQIKDARVNLTGSDWKICSLTSSNIGDRNTLGESDAANYAVVIDCDSEYWKDTTGNEKPTLADLRFISRGQAGRTLKIVYDDKELLDQLTTMDDTNPQLIDINTRSVNIWKGLLKNIKTEDGTADILTDVDTVAKNISKNIRIQNKFFKRRSDAVEFLLSQLDTSVDSPLLVGKMISLCKTEDYPEYVHLIVVAQTVKDNQGLGNVGTYDAEHDEITSEVRYLVKLRRTEDYKMEIISIEELID